MSPGQEANKIDNDRIFMRSAIELAKRSADEGEVPVGAVIVKNGKIVATGRNRRENDKNATVHAELQAIDRACSVLGGWRLWECELYVTMEPCPMCAGAIINSRIKRVVFGAYDQKAGSCGSVINLFDLPYNHKPELVGGFMRDECSAVLTGFFKDLREKKKR
ncbi:MAG: tRNA adenosine(34) deaminase TadA [Clostridia bacterium]|nr:tRNA adenosine(34) deaminase TadA [Clostridia bacterium]